MSTSRHGLAIGVLGLAVAALALAWWIPTDIESGLIIQEHRSVQVGDALAPTVAAIGIAVVSMALVVGNLLARGSNSGSHDEAEGDGWRHMGGLAAILGASVLLMVVTGPLVVRGLQAAGFGVPDYRLLIATRPWKYVGFVLGGTVLVAGLIGWIEGRVSARGILVGLLAVGVLVAFYDLPFDTLLLPPNGDQ